MIRQVAALILVLLTVIAVGGCSFGEDTNEIAYIILIGVDKGREGKILVTYQIESFTQKNGEKDKDDSQKNQGANQVTIEAEGLAQAVDYLTSIVSRTPRFAHLKAIIVGEEYAREGIISIIDTIKRDSNFRSNIYFLVVNSGTAREFISKNNPPLESLPAKYISAHMYLSKHSNYFLESRFPEFYNRLKNNSAAPYAALAGINPQNGVGQTRSGEADLTGDGYYAGEIIRFEDFNPDEIMGTALFRKDKMIGKLDNEETQLAVVLRKNFKSWNLYIDDPNAPQYKLGVEVKHKKKPKIEVMIVDEKPQIKIEMDFMVKLTNVPGNADYEQENLRRQVEAILANHILEKTKKMLDKTQKLGADVVGFGYLARTQFRTYQEFMEFNWAEAYSRAEIEVKVATTIEKYGLMRKTTPME